MGGQVSRVSFNFSEERKKSYDLKNDFLLGTIRMILHLETAQHAFLSFLNEETILQQQQGQQGSKNFVREMSYIELISRVRSHNDFSKAVGFGPTSSSFHQFSSYSSLIQDDPNKSLEFLRQLEDCEQYLMVVSVICGLNDFMRSDWHALWQQIEMQSTDPPPQTFPAVCREIAERFSAHDSEFQFFLKTGEVTTVFDLLVACLKHLPFPLAVMEMSASAEWFPISTVNAAFVALTGYTEEQVKGMTIKSLCSDFDRDLLALMRTEILQGDGTRAILPLHRSDGSIMICAVGVIPIFDADRSVICFLGLLDDIASPNSSLTRLKILSDLLDSIPSDLNLSPCEDNPFCGTSVGYLI
jgi:PAS domain S-box-containing protein